MVAFVVERETSAPEESRNKDFVDSVARALDLLPGQYVLTYPERVPEARLWVFLGDLPVFEVKADKLIKTEVVGKLVESVALKKELWLRLKALKESGLLTL